MLERGVEGQPDNQDKDVGEYAGQGEEISNRALGGYKATLKSKFGPPLALSIPVHVYAV